MALKEYKDSTIYVLTMLIIFTLSFINSMEIISSGFYGFTIGSGIYFGVQYICKKNKIAKN